MGRVSIVRTGGGIDSALQRSLELIGGMGEFIHPQETVMLKPNINGTEGVTSIDLVESLIRLLRDFGVGKITVAEATFGNERMTDMFFAKSGYGEMVNRYGIDLINLNRSEAVDVPVRNPHILGSLQVAREVFETDRIINIPVMKVHYATGVTLALKNLKGLLVLGQKRHFHEVGLDEAIVDLSNTIKPDLNIIDCIQCMERMGPRGGDLVDLNLLIAGAERAETDYVGCLIMEHVPDEVGHLRLYMEDHRIDPSKIEVIGEKIDDVKYPFKKAQMTGAIPQGFLVHNIDACSSCMNALLLSFANLEKEISHDMHVYLGEKIDQSAAGVGYKIAFGNCCDKGVAYDLVIKGCPPYPFDLNNRLG
ncbi:MAG: DUF362 domain-containing protein [Syntrophales bacterium]|nr:DUF362 domain-containing protein [Syntrophales bacterium]